MSELYRWQECIDFDIQTIQKLYRSYVNPRQVDLIGAFGFGRTVAQKAEGMYIFTSNGDKILDFTGGVGVLNHGHNHPEIIAARLEYQKHQRMEVHKNYLSQYIAGLSHNIAKLLPEDLDISYFSNSGSEAVEGAVKLAYKYFNGERKYVLHSNISFHGKLLGAAGLTASPELYFSFPTINDVKSFIYNNIDDVTRLVSQLRNANGKSDVYAIILEPFSASSLRHCSTEYLTELRELCDKENIILIFDEVYTGWAKTGELFYFMNHGVIPDIVTYAKSFGGGKSSIAGYTSRRKFFMGAYGNLRDSILHSTTYNGFGEETVTAIEAIRIIIEENFVEKSKAIFKHLNLGLVWLQDKYPDLIDEVRGSGALNGIIMNKNIDESLESIIKLIPGGFFKDPRIFAKLITSAVIAELYNTHKILTYYGDNIDVPLTFSPSLIVEKKEMDYLIKALDDTLSLGRYKLLYNFVKQKFIGR